MRSFFSRLRNNIESTFCTGLNWLKRGIDWALNLVGLGDSDIAKSICYWAGVPVAIAATIFAPLAVAAVLGTVVVVGFYKTFFQSGADTAAEAMVQAAMDTVKAKAAAAVALVETEVTELLDLDTEAAVVADAVNDTVTA